MRQLIASRIPGLYRSAALVRRRLRRLTDLTVGLVETSGYRRRLRATHAPTLPDDVAAPRVVLDACAFENPHTGIARVWASLMDEWSQSGFARHIVVLDRAATAPRLPGFTYRAAPPLRAADSRSQRALLEDVCDAERADVFVTTLYTQPDARPSLLFVHDLTPELLGWDLRDPVWRDKQRAIRTASAYACNSQNTLADLHRVYPESSGKPATVAPLGVDARFRPAPPEDVRALVDHLDLPARYYVFIGHRDIHKNAELVFQAVAGLQDDPDLGLLLVGGRPHLEPHFAELAGRVPVRIARLSDEELRAAYTGAAALLYVSRYEGFGLAVLEAMACGCPVITCRNSALPEAAGDAACYVGEDDPEALRQAMRQVREEGTRRRFVELGTARAELFKWSETARHVQRAIEELAFTSSPL